MTETVEPAEVQGPQGTFGFCMHEHTEVVLLGGDMLHSDEHLGSSKQRAGSAGKKANSGASSSTDQPPDSFKYFNKFKSFNNQA